MHQRGRTVNLDEQATDRYPPAKWKRCPPPSPRARESEGTREWGGAGIVVLNESATRVAGGGHEEGNHNSLLWNGTTRRENASTGGGSPGACVGGQHENQHTGNHDVLQQTGAGTRTATTQWERQQETGPEGPEVGDDKISWEEAAWEEIHTAQRRTTGRIPIAERWARTRQQDKLRDQQRASRWRNKYPTQPQVQQNIAHFKKGAAECQCAQIPTYDCICAAMSHEGTATMTHLADTACHAQMAETIYAARTQEEALVQDLLEQWRKGGHGYVPDEKGDDIIQLGCENVNSLSLFHPTKSKQKKLLNLHDKYQMDGACILEHGITDGTRPGDIFAAYRGTQVSAAHNVHEQHSRYQQGGTLTATFTCLAGYVTATGVDPTGLGWWSWIQVGAGEHRTRIISAYQPCRGTGRVRLGREGQLLHGGPVAAQHDQYFRKKGIFTTPRKAFVQQVVTQLRAWRASGEGIILFADMNEKVSGKLAQLLRSDGLLMDEQTLKSTGQEAPYSHQMGQDAIVGTFATPEILCTNSYLSPHGAGNGDHRFQVHDFDAHSILGTKYLKTTRPSGRALRCTVAKTVKKYNTVLKQLLIRHRSFE